MKKILVIIPARSGSKGLLNKNILLLNGKPLIHYTIDAARNVFKDEEIIVSTDCEKIKLISQQSGLKINFLRPKKLALDNSSTYDVIIHEINEFEKKNGMIDVVVLLQPTSPLRKPNHIIDALELYNDKTDMVVSVKKTHSNPYFNLFEENKKGYLSKVKQSNYTRRQDCPDVWEYNGSIYIINAKSIKKMNFNKFTKIKKYVMDDYHSIDIDNKIDFKLCEVLLNENN